jgi:hypothetical protein
MEYPVQHVGNIGKVLDQFIRANLDYLFMGFTVLCFAVIVWLLCRKGKVPPPPPADARTRAIIGTMLASPDMLSDADGGRTRLIWGDPGRCANTPGFSDQSPFV